MSEELKMTFEPNTIEHLGVRMYSTLPPVLAELIANSYDADAENVILILDDTDKEKEIIILDDGSGMSYDEINDKFLRIGRNRREDEHKEITPKKRKVIGKKGLGKLSFFGIAHEIEISTKKAGLENVFVMSWEDIMKAKNEYRPTIIKRDVKCSETVHGTTISLRKIQRKSNFAAEDLANTLARIFIMDSDFKVVIKHNSDPEIAITNERRFAGLDKEVEWNVPASIQFKSEYDKAAGIKGFLIATSKPISPKSIMRGITLFSRKKLVNLPEYFSDSTSSHFFSYLTGWLEVDFIDDIKPDVIATNRQSLNWDHEEMIVLRGYLQGLIRWLEQDWRKKRADIRNQKIADRTKINISNWLSKLPDEIRTNVEPVLLAITLESELPEETQQRAVERFHDIVPEYPFFHWRHLHDDIKNASFIDYEKRDYYRAFTEAVKRYINTVRTRSKCANTSDSSMMGEVFGRSKVLQVAAKFKKPNGNDFSRDTIDNIEEGQKFLSMGILAGCRNPVAHEEICDLRDSNLFTEKDCLDALSLLSHLFYRLDRA